MVWCGMVCEVCYGMVWCCMVWYVRYSKNPHIEQVFWGFRLILFLYIGCFLQNQPENVFKVFLKLFL